MAGTGKPFDSLRLNRFENERLVMALAISLLVHLIAWGGYEFGKEFGLWRPLPLPAWLHPAEKIKPLAAAQNNEEPLEFVEVEQPSAEAPKNAKYYSSRNSRAANPDADRDLNNPQLNGKQTDVPKTEDVLRPQFSKSQANNQQESQETKPSLSVGDLILGKPDVSQQQERPRTLKQAYAQMANRMPGQMMKQEGGVHRRLEISSLDVKATSFGAYDAALIDAVTQCWYNYIDEQHYALDRQGRVIVQFRLHSDGSVTDLKLVGDTVDDNVGGVWAYICQAAIEKAAPFASWPSDMLHQIGSNFREVRFTFYY